MPGLSDTDQEVMRRELRRIYPWASSRTLDAVADLVTGQLDAHEGEPTYTMDRFERARAIGAVLAELVGPAPPRFRVESETVIGSKNVTESWWHGGSGFLRGLNPRGLRRGLGGDEHRGQQR